MKIQIGFLKSEILPSGYEANFWAIGQRNLTFDENAETNFFTPKIAAIDMLLYKDVDAYINNVSTGIMKRIEIPYYIEDLAGGTNIIKLCSDRILENEYFAGCEVVEIEVDFENQTIQ